MSLPDIISNLFFEHNSFFYWRDLLEISFFITLFYYTSLWLKKDKQKNLVPYFYGYCACAFGAHHLGLTTVSYTLFLFAPVTAMIFILIHQDILQRNVVALKNITPAKRVQINWLETLIKTTLVTINNGKSVTCVIEHKDALENFLETPLHFNALLDQGLLTILFASDAFDEKQLVWVNTQGKLVGINASWKKLLQHEHLEPGVKKLPDWKQQAIFFSSKTDALIMHSNPTSRTFDVILNGMIVDRMHATKTVELIKKYVMSKSTSQWGVVNHEALSQKNISQQHTN